MGIPRWGGREGEGGGEVVRQPETGDNFFSNTAFSLLSRDLPKALAASSTRQISPWMFLLQGSEVARGHAEVLERGEEK